jgi:hypothetical protein
MNKRLIISILYLLTALGCFAQNPIPPGAPDAIWQVIFDRQLPLFGHRNWILIVDKAYPLQSAEGVETVYTYEGLERVVKGVLQRIGKANHISPIIYTDVELQALTDSLAPGVDSLKTFYEKTFTGLKSFSVPHEEIFLKIDKAAELFKILVLKTNSTIPYSSVFIELDCGYWSEKSEKALRETMNNNEN